MAIVGFHFDSMRIEKLKKAEPGLKISHGLNITDMKKEDIGISSAKEQVVRFDFKFVLHYDPKIADLELLGHVLYLLEGKKADKMLKEWKSTKKMDTDVMRQVLNAILLKSNIKALMLSEEMNLPPHLQMPSLNLMPKKKKVVKKKPKAKAN